MILKVFTEEDLNPPPPTETENKELWKRAWLLQHNSNECSPGERVVKMVENDSYSQPWILNAQNGERLVNLLQQSITFVQVKEKDHPATSNNKKNNIKIFKRSIQVCIHTSTLINLLFYYFILMNDFPLSFYYHYHPFLVIIFYVFNLIYSLVYLLIII